MSHPIVCLKRFVTFCGVSLALVQPLLAQQPQYSRESNGIAVHVSGKTVRLQVISANILRVTASPDGSIHHPSIAVLPQPNPTTTWHVAVTSTSIVLSTPTLKAQVNAATGAVTFVDAVTGKIVLAEAGRALTPATVQGEQTTHVQQQWQADPTEALYGLGQQQLGILDIKGYDLDLWQHNTNVVVPFLVSSKGYGIFWDNTSHTRFGDLRDFQPIPTYSLFNANGVAGGLTLTYPGTSIPAATTDDLSLHFIPTKTDNQPRDREWNGSLLAPVTGDYQFLARYNGGLKVWIDGKPVIDHWRQLWLTGDDEVKLHLLAGQRYSLRLQTDGEQQTRMNFRWKTPPSTEDTSLWSEVGDGIDYYFVYGPRIDNVIAGYRTLTGRANMMPDWIFGLWQSRQRYETAQQSLDVVKEFRRRKIPFDNIVQDWQYWRPDSWGSQQFDSTRFPDPAGWIKDIHALHTHMMISVWGKFNPDTVNGKQMMARGYLYEPDLKAHTVDWIGYPYSFYDAFNAGARKLFWSQMNTGIFSKGVDAWWMDASEPDLLPGEPPASVEDQKDYMNPTAMGTGARMLNGWGLMNSSAVYDGQREVDPDQRVFILTRSGYAGQQRYSTATWSGDVTSTWSALAKQIPAGLGMSLAGVPYWTTDTAGYTMQQKFTGHPDTAANPADEDEFRELNARWFEFSTFTPLLRVHGELRPREIWILAGNKADADQQPVYQAELKYDRIRYHLFPYIYSLAGAVTQHDGTIMRPLVMDFPNDEKARTLTDEFLFGPSLLIAPVLHYHQRSREVYLPGNSPWYNLWTGAVEASGQLNAEAPYDSIPVFVRAGSILPLGPDIQYIGEKPETPLTLQIFEGADGHFTLYEDQGLTFAYEHGAFTEIPITWNDSSKTLTIGERKGNFPEMLKQRTFQIVVTSKSMPTAFSFAPTPIKSIEYKGSPITTKLP